MSETSVNGLIGGTRTSGEAIALSPEEDSDSELLDDAVDFFLVMLRARTGPSVAVLLIEFCLLTDIEAEVSSICGI